MLNEIEIEFKDLLLKSNFNDYKYIIFWIQHIVLM